GGERERPPLRRGGPGARVPRGDVGPPQQRRRGRRLLLDGALGPERRRAPLAHGAAAGLRLPRQAGRGRRARARRGQAAAAVRERGPKRNGASLIRTSAAADEDGGRGLASPPARSPRSAVFSTKASVPE